MAIPSYGRKEPLLISVEEIRKDVASLRMNKASGDVQKIWEAAGHIWESANWVADMGKDSKIKADAWRIRKALTEVILSSKTTSDLSGFTKALQEIEDACTSIQGKL